MVLKLTPFSLLDEDQIKQVLAWRNDLFVRSQMSNTDEIAYSSHKRFVENLQEDESNLYYMVVYEDDDIGVVYLNNLDNYEAELGLYKNPEIKKRGVGSILMKAIFRLAKQKRLKKLTLKVLKSNNQAIWLYEKFEFVVVSKDREYIYMEKELEKNVFIVAELSANHNHDIEIAKKSIKAVVETGADAVKIQTYTADTMTIDCDNEYFQINQGTQWDGRTFYDLYKEAYTPWEWHEELRDYAESFGLTFFSTPFDLTAVDYLERMKNPIYKIASFEITDIPLIEYAASKGKPMIISTGIAEMQEIHDAVKTCRDAGNNDITLLKCTSSYPAPVDQANLRTMVNMKETFGVKVGLSDHTVGSDVAIAAAALGAEIIEKHFILDRDIGGSDASFSMEPDEFKSMVTSIRNVEKALGTVTYELSERTRNNREFSRSLFVVKDIKKGEIITKDNVRSIRPGYGLAPKYLKDVIGRKAGVDIVNGTPVSWDLFG